MSNSSHNRKLFSSILRQNPNKNLPYSLSVSSFLPDNSPVTATQMDHKNESLAVKPHRSYENLIAYNKLMKPTPKFHESGVSESGGGGGGEGGKTVMDVSIFSPASVSTVAESSTSARSNSSHTNRYPNNHSRGKESIQLVSPQSNDTRDKASVPSVFSDEFAKLSSVQTSVVGSATGPHLHSSSLSPSSTSATVPHVKSYEALLHYLYTGDDRYLMQLLNESTDNFFGIVKNAWFMGFSNDESITNNPYDIVMKSITSPAKLMAITHDSQFIEGQVPSGFVKMLIGYSKNNRMMSELDLLLVILWWKRILLQQTQQKHPQHQHFKDNKYDFAKDFVEQLDFNLMPREMMKKALYNHNILNPVASLPSDNEFGEFFKVPETIIKEITEISVKKDLQSLGSSELEDRRKKKKPSLIQAIKKRFSSKK